MYKITVPLDLLAYRKIASLTIIMLFIGSSVPGCQAIFPTTPVPVIPLHHGIV